MLCPKCRAKTGLYLYKGLTQTSVARGVTCAVCGYWIENTLRFVKPLQAYSNLQSRCHHTMLSSWTKDMARHSFTDLENVQRSKQLRDQANKFDEDGFNTDQAAEDLGTICRALLGNRSNICDQEDAHKKTRGGRLNSLMSIEEEKEFLSQWQEKAAAGRLLTVPQLHAELVKRIGHEIPMSTTYRLLARHGWRKVQPGHEFKENCRKQWLPPA